jgi:large subunit ribosomal protein L27
MAHVKAARTAKGNKDSISKRLGVKKSDGSIVKAGNIIVRQRGSKYIAGKHTYYGNDFTIHADTDGIVVFGKKFGRTSVSVKPRVA